MNVLSYSYPVSVMNKTVNVQSQGRRYNSQQKLANLYCLFMRYEDVRVSVCYIQVYTCKIIRPRIGIHL